MTSPNPKPEGERVELPTRAPSCASSSQAPLRTALDALALQAARSAEESARRLRSAVPSSAHAAIPTIRDQRGRLELTLDVNDVVDLEDLGDRLLEVRGFLCRTPDGRMILRVRTEQAPPADVSTARLDGGD